MLRYLFSPYGRSGRVAFWGSYGVCLAVAAIGAPFICLAIAGRELVGDGVCIFLFVLTVCAANWTPLVVGIRRLHDRGKSGWWMLAFHAPAAMAVHHVVLDPGYQGDPITAVAYVVAWVWYFVELGLLPGDPPFNGYEAEGETDLDALAARLAGAVVSTDERGRGFDRLRN